MSLTDSYNEILVHTTVKDDYFKSVIGAGGETLNMMTFSLTIKYDDDGLIGAKFYQGVTYTESDGVTVITNESYFEYTVLRDVTEGTARWERKPWFSKRPTRIKSTRSSNRKSTAISFA